MDTALGQCYSCPSGGPAGPLEPRCPHRTGWGRTQAASGTGTGGSRAAETAVSSLAPCYPSQPPVQEGPHLDGVKDEFLGAVGAGLGALGALRGGVLGQQPPHHAGTTLVLTVHALLGAHALVALWKCQRARVKGYLAHQVPPSSSPLKQAPPTSKASPLKSQPQNSHLRRRLGQSCCKWAGRSRRLSLVGQRLGQGTTLKLQVFR